MIKKIGICNFKGGVGKTVVAINLSYGLSRLPAKVILIDLDPQLNSITGLGVQKKEIIEHKYIMLNDYLTLSIDGNLQDYKYDYAIYDLPPKDLKLVDFIIQICNEIIVPVVPDFFSLEGLAQILGYIKERKELYNKDIAIGVLINQYEGNEFNAQICKMLNTHFKDIMYFTIIPKDDTIKIALSFGKSVIEYNTLSASSISFLLLCKEIRNGRRNIW